MTAAQEEHPIRLAFAGIGRFLARAVRSPFRAKASLAVPEKAATSASPMEEAGVPSEPEPQEAESLGSSDDPRDLIE